MKIIANRFYVVVIYLLGIFGAFASPSPPPPTHRSPPPPPPLPIDENIFLVLISAITFGIYIVYKHSLKTKTPI